MPDSDWHRRLAERLSALQTHHLLRQRSVVTPIDATHVRLNGRTLVNFASNDYLGLTQHPRVIEAARAATEQYGAGTGAAPLISGYTDAHASAEAAIARWKGTESAVLLSSGYQANMALVQTLAATGGARFLLDKLCHASLIDAVRAVAYRTTADHRDDVTPTSFRVFPHNGIEKLRRLLEGGSARGRDVIVTESIFSMDGDAADLAAIVDLCGSTEKDRPLLLLDEAHGSGVYGPAGEGLAAEVGLAHRVDATLVTLSKALGCSGAAVCGPRVLCDALVNLGRAYIFSTSLPASVAASAEAALAILQGEPERQRRLRSIARHVRQELTAMDLHLPQGAQQPGDSPIIPIFLPSEAAALAAAGALRESGLLTLAIRPPTVPRGSSRLRITISSEHADADVGLLLSAIRRHKEALRP